MADFANSKHNYPIYTGPHFLCHDCQTLFISEEFLNKHQKKCIHRKLNLILKMKFQLGRNTSTDDTSNQIKSEITEDYFCDECFSGFLTLSDFESHRQEGHPEELLFTSNFNDRKYIEETKVEPLIAINSQSEKAFNVSVHNPSVYAAKQSLTCPNDPERMKSKQTSLGTHSNNMPNRRDDCNKRESCQYNLSSHLLYHPEEKTFTCHHCGKGFSEKSSLNRHLLVHTGEKPFVCDYCNKRFSQKRYLKRHLLVHTGERPFVCDHCNKRFTRMDNLKIHLKIHT